MSLFLSAPSGLRIIGGRVLFLTALAWCLIPSAIGTIGWLLTDLSGNGRQRTTLSDPHMLYYLLMLSPLITGPFWLAITAATALFTRRGCYGLLVAAASGAVAGALFAWTTEAPSMVLLGVVLAMLHRFTLALLRPLAF